MTSWSTPALLLLGIAAGPHGLDLLSTSVLLLLDPGIAMAVALLGVFVGLSFAPRQPRILRSIAASASRTLTTVVIVGTTAMVVGAYWLNPGSPLWLMALMLGVCTAVSNAEADVNADDVLMIVAGGIIVSAIHVPAAGPLFLLTAAFIAISITVAMAAWLLVGQTDSEGEQHVFVVGSLLLLGGAATYLSQSASFAGLTAGVAWKVAQGLATTRVVRDLHYFQHPLVVLGLVTAGASVTASANAMALAAIVVTVRRLSRPIAAWTAGWHIRLAPASEITPSRISAGLVGIALALDVARIESRPEWGLTLLSAVVVGSIVSAALDLLIPPRDSAA
jgi:hypothetical protein